jgi:hypothetical protein
VFINKTDTLRITDTLRKLDEKLIIIIIIIIIIIRVYAYKSWGVGYIFAVYFPHIQYVHTGSTCVLMLYSIGQSVPGDTVSGGEKRAKVIRPCSKTRKQRNFAQMSCW